MFEVQILIPLKGNDGKQFTPDHHVVFETFVLIRFGGLSRLPGTIDGWWVDRSTTYVDELIAYVISLRSLADGHLIGEVVAFAKVHYGQLAIYIRYLGLSETI